MNKVTTLNLNGKAYQIEESGYEALRLYLDEAKAKLEGNPDKDEIMSDFEQAIADKCNRYLSSHKTVILSADIESILKEMGPVNAEEKTDTDGTKEQAKSGPASSKDQAGPKRLYRIREGEMIFGVCRGLAVYFDIDVTLIRVIFIILALVTHGLWCIVYVILMAVMPRADTLDKQARAFGAPPITAQTLLDRAKDGYSQFKNSEEWRRWKRQMREEARQWKQEWKYNRHADNYWYGRSPFWEFMNSILGLVWFVVIIFCFWWGYNHIGIIHQFLDLVAVWIKDGAGWIVSLWRKIR